MRMSVSKMIRITLGARCEANMSEQTKKPICLCCTAVCIFFMHIWRAHKQANPFVYSLSEMKSTLYREKQKQRIVF